MNSSRWVLFRISWWLTLLFFFWLCFVLNCCTTGQVRTGLSTDGTHLRFEIDLPLPSGDGTIDDWLSELGTTPASLPNALGAKQTAP